jgi:RHS repeat-associated protein
MSLYFHLTVIFNSGYSSREVKINGNAWATRQIFVTTPAASPGTPCPTSGPYQYTYDAENHLVTAAAVNYTYDGDGKRVQKSNGKLYWYGTGSDALSETDSAGNTTADYVFFGGKRVAMVNASTLYYVGDALGTSRVMTNSSGAICYDADFYPFGGERTATTPTCMQNYKFTGKERDGESGLDNFGARFTSSATGRFVSPDWSAAPSPVPYAEFQNPQTLNLYAYVKNNPVTFGDPNGHCWSWAQGLCNFAQKIYYGGFTNYGFKTHAEVTEVRKQETAARRQWLLQNNVVTPDSKGNTIDWSTASDKQVNNSFQKTTELLAMAMFAFKLAHDPATILGNDNLNSIRQMSTQEIIDSLNDVKSAEQMMIKPDGTVLQGNTRLFVLQERGLDINNLGLQPGVRITEPMAPWEEDMIRKPSDPPPDNE